MIDIPDAAAIDPGLQGRGYARIASGAVAQFQGAWASAPADGGAAAGTPGGTLRATAAAVRDGRGEPLPRRASRAPRRPFGSRRPDRPVGAGQGGRGHRAAATGAPGVARPAAAAASRWPRCRGRAWQTRRRPACPHRRTAWRTCPASSGRSRSTFDLERGSNLLIGGAAAVRPDHGAAHDRRRDSGRLLPGRRAPVRARLRRRRRSGRWTGCRTAARWSGIPRPSGPGGCSTGWTPRSAGAGTCCRPAASPRSPSSAAGSGRRGPAALHGAAARLLGDVRRRPRAGSTCGRPAATLNRLLSQGAGGWAAGHHHRRARSADASSRATARSAIVLRLSGPNDLTARACQGARCPRGRRGPRRAAAGGHRGADRLRGPRPERRRRRRAAVNELIGAARRRVPRGGARAAAGGPAAAPGSRSRRRSRCPAGRARCAAAGPRRWRRRARLARPRPGPGALVRASRGRSSRASPRRLSCSPRRCSRRGPR